MPLDSEDFNPQLMTSDSGKRSSGKTSPLVLGMLSRIASLDPAARFSLVSPVVLLGGRPYAYLARPARVSDELRFKWQEQGRGP